MRGLLITVFFVVLFNLGCIVHARGPRGSVTMVRPATPTQPTIVVIKRKPSLRPIPKTRIKWFAGHNYDIYFVNGYYYLYHRGVWYRSTTYHGGWVRIRYLPRVFLTIPRTHPRYNIIIRFTIR